MGGKGGGAPTAPNYQPIAQSDIQAAQIAAQTSQSQLDWAKQQYAQEWPYVQNYMNATTGQMSTDQAVQQANIQAAQQQQRMYQQTYQPIERQFAQTATGYATPQRAAQQAGMAEADVAQTFAGQRQAALQGLESYGIDPSQTRYGALDLGTRISQAGAQAAAGTQSQLNTLGTGLGLQSEAINIGRGYPGSVAQTYATAQGAGQGVTQSGAAGIGAGTNTATQFGSLMGTPYQWANLQQGALGGAASAQNLGFSNQLSSFATNAQIAQNQMGGIGSLVGGLGAAALLHYSDRRVKEGIRRIGETDSGIPVIAFRYKDEPKGAIHMGVIAQDVEKKIPEAVYKDYRGVRLVDYRKVS